MQVGKTTQRVCTDLHKYSASAAGKMGEEEEKLLNQKPQDLIARTECLRPSVGHHGD